MSQCALLSTWIGLGKAPRRIRKTMLLLFVGGMAGWTVKWGSRGVADNFFPSILEAVVGSGLLTALSMPWEMLRRRGFDLVKTSDATQRGAGQDFQFSLRQIFGLTTIVAMLFAIGQFTPRLAEMDGAEIHGRSLPTVGALLAIGGFILYQISVMLLAGWAALSPGDCRPRLLALLFAALFLGALVPYYFRGGQRAFALWTGTSVCHAAILSLSLLVFRACGYRLVRIAQKMDDEPLTSL